MDIPDQEEEVGPEVSEFISKMVNKCMRVEEKLPDRPNRPGNCANLVQTRVNTEVWSGLPTSAQKGDIRLQRVHDALVASMIYNVNAPDRLFRMLTEGDKSVTSNELREVLKMLRNALLFGGHAAAQVNARRKEALTF